MKYKSKIIVALSSLIFTIPILSACASTNPKVITFALSENYFGLSATKSLQKELLTEIKKIKTTDSKYSNVLLEQINVRKIEDSSTKLQEINANKVQFAFVPTYQVFKSGVKDFDIVLQTETDAFKGDETLSYYSPTNNPLEKVAQALNDNFSNPAYKTWFGKNSQKKEIEVKEKDQKVEGTNTKNWNGIRYNDIYANPRKLVPFYRGMIMIYGTDEQLKQIKDAWNKKDWNAFKKFGIAGGKTSSAGKFVLQELLLKKHFNNAFTTLEEEKLKDKNFKLLTGQSGSNIGWTNLKDYHIFFDDESSYAWTQNNTTNDQHFYTPQVANTKAEVFMVTNPMGYDLGIFNKSIAKPVQQIISQAFINLAKANKDPYGPLGGYNGYSFVSQKNLDDFQNKTLKV
ncbi:Extracytoplasmic thiamine-binding lipoprotein [[Mycoplasma] cavipharyngis]|uniref:ABC transporter thiamine pyrophosphate-binding lipoprotein p37/Cypl n=1 Tax=[Mycoplasma] cavipharyngis TaxID=92757 RepID=UPI0037040894